MVRRYLSIFYSCSTQRNKITCIHSLAVSQTRVFDSVSRATLITTPAVYECLWHKQHLRITCNLSAQTVFRSHHLLQTDAARMSCVTRFVLLLIAAECLQDTTCRLERNQLAQLLQNIYSSEQPHSTSRRNTADIANVLGNGILQEASSRDLDVDFAVGVKDDNSDSESVINSYSSNRAYFPNFVTDQAIPGFYSVEKPPSNELNIGLFVDPKSGISYYSPGYAPGNSFVPRPNIVPKKYGSASLVPNIVQPNPVLTSVTYPVLLNPYQHSPFRNVFNSGRYATVIQAANYMENPTHTISELNALPYPYQNNPQHRLGSTGHFVVTPLQTYSATNEESSPNINYLQQTVYPYQRLYREPLEVPHNLQSVNDLSGKLPDIFRQNPTTVNSLYPSNYPENYGLFPVAKRHQHFPKGPYRQFSQPVVLRQEPQESWLVLDQQGTPVMSAQPYGDRQVGTFRLRHDNGYQVSVSLHVY